MWRGQPHLRVERTSEALLLYSSRSPFAGEEGPWQLVGWGRSLAGYRSLRAWASWIVRGPREEHGEDEELPVAWPRPRKIPSGGMGAVSTLLPSSLLGDQ